ncbi:MAG: preprotein translocase subunit SecE [Thermoleophilaceae bacterium]
MARDRQRSKQRQAERRARRLQQQGSDGQARADIPGVTPEPIEPVQDPGPPGVDVDHLEAGAPPEELGRSDFTLEHDEALVDRDEHEAALDDEEAAELAEEQALEEIEDWELDDPDAAVADRGAGESGYAVRGRRGREAHEAHKHRPRVIQFLIAVWAELQRVQWPNRQALVTLTGVVLGFVLIAGGYLGLLDAIFSKLIQAIL